MTSTQAGHSKVPYPRLFVPLRIIQLLIALAVLGICAYHIHIFRKIGCPDYAGFGLFTSIATLIYIVYWLVAASSSGRAIYNFWVILALEIFMVVIWLCTFALFAAIVARVKFSSTKGLGAGPLPATLYTALALSVVNFILFATTFILHTVHYLKHRKSLAAGQAQNSGRVE